MTSDAKVNILPKISSVQNDKYPYNLEIYLLVSRLMLDIFGSLTERRVRHLPEQL